MIEIISDERLRTIFGKKELEIIKKQLMEVNLSPSERTRLSRNIRKKLEAVNLLCRYEDEFKLKKGSEIFRIVEETLQVIKEHVLFPKIKKIMLFGSTSNRTRTLKSDIDISVEFFEISKPQATQFRIDISGKVNELVDVQVYNVLLEKIKKGIDSGKVLYDSNK